MILFLSTVFLRRLELAWKSGFQAFLIGNRNLDFQTPEAFVEVDEISPTRIDDFLRTKELGQWELLGWITSGEIELLPGYVSVKADGRWAPESWTATIRNPGEADLEDMSVQLRISSEYRPSRIGS